MDAQTIRRALRDFFKFDPKDFSVRACATGFLVSSNARRSTVAARLSFFQLVDATERVGLAVTRKVRVVASTIDGELPAGMNALDNPIYALEVSGEGVVWAGVSFDKTTGERTSPFFDSGEEIPADTDSLKHLLIGGFAVPVADGEAIAVNNVEFGPLRTESCRLWFVSPEEWDFAWEAPTVLSPGG